MNHDNSGWRSLLTRGDIVQILVPLSAVAFLTGTCPTDTALLLHLQRTQGFTEDAAVLSVSIKTYSAIIFALPVIVFILAYGTRHAIISGTVSYLLFLVCSIQQAVPELAQLGCVLAGYSATTWIACCCCGRYLLKEEFFLFYYACIACYYLAGHFISFVLDALVLESILGVPTPFYLAVVTSAVNLAISFFWIPTQRHVDTGQGGVDSDVVVGPRGRCLGTRQDWPRLGYSLVAAMKIKTLRRIVVWYMLEYAVYLGIQSRIADYLSSGGFGEFDSAVGCYLLASLAGFAALATASTFPMRTVLSDANAVILITLVGVSSTIAILVLTLGQDWPLAYVAASITLVLLGSFQFTLAVGKIAAYVPAELTVVLYGVTWLVSMMIKVSLESLVPRDEQYNVYSAIWFLVNFGYALRVICARDDAHVVPQVVVESRTSDPKDDEEHSISQAPQNEISVASEVRE